MPVDPFPFDRPPAGFPFDPVPERLFRDDEPKDERFEFDAADLPRNCFFARGALGDVTFLPARVLFPFFETDPARARFLEFFLLVLDAPRRD